MANTKVKSLSDADTRLAALNTEILALEIERSALLEAELENARTRVGEIQSFIGIYQASSPVGASAPSTTKRASKKTASGKRRGRPPGSGAKKQSTKAPSTKKRDAKKKSATASATAPKKKRTRGNNADRLDAVQALVKKAGAAGISARQVAKETNFPYVSVLNILNTPANFKKQGEKRDRRYFIK